MNKYKSFQVIASKKGNNLKIVEEEIAQIIYLHQQLSYSAKYLCKVLDLFVWKSYAVALNQYHIRK